MIRFIRIATENGGIEQELVKQVATKRGLLPT